MFKTTLAILLNPFATLLVLNYFPAEDLSIWWNVASSIISLISYMTHTHRFTSRTEEIYRMMNL